ncbi:RsmB/NOP family class I SAM-dependent RNA methyltransferase [Bauldia litoralis]|uniref:16S rRNA (Cytosine967-C5)-methyltransferase n=1 Tax=Bauldia litoralis TaxID=665467 RepID=A0A1G6DFM4_9HYPH|nr:RsmB/NOP family class I SAM-dependent RNA methyltransferase [Bauldia litoralis]SDB43933.1 16S rRNA (cytosine967-C5)-methyltransferase [Bauldia litoralis]
MTPAARLAAAIEVVADMETRHRPVAGALKDWGLSHRFAGSKDRAAIGNIVYDTLRWRSSSAWAMGEESPRALVLGMAGRHWGMDGARLAALIDGVPHAPELLTGTERERIDTADLSTAPGHVRADIPEWLAPHFERSFGDAWIAEGVALALRPPLDLRVNRLKADRDKVMKSLGKLGAAETTFAPDGLRIAATEKDGRHPNVQVEPAFQRGLFEIQDEGSQLAALMVGAKPGEQVLDLCAGAGGKTLALAAAMENKGQILATDSDRTRLAPIFDRLKRAGTRNGQVRPAGDSLDDLDGKMDAVLIDAPCTGTGTWRRRPDAKWRLSERNLADRIAEQSALLTAAVRYLKPGGRLVYVTCSMMPDENDDRIAAFVAATEGMTPVDPKTAVERSLGAELGPRLVAASRLTAHGVMMTPATTGTDGFFVSVLERTG